MQYSVELRIHFTESTWTPAIPFRAAGHSRHNVVSIAVDIKQEMKKNIRNWKKNCFPIEQKKYVHLPTTYTTAGCLEAIDS